jgi:hypothetical protein
LTVLGVLVVIYVLFGVIIIGTVVLYVIIVLVVFVLDDGIRHFLVRDIDFDGRS